MVRYKLKTKLKTPRPRSAKQNDNAEQEFKKNSLNG